MKVRTPCSPTQSENGADVGYLVFFELSRSLFSRGQARQGHGCGSVSGQEAGVSRSRDGCVLKPWI